MYKKIVSITPKLPFSYKQRTITSFDYQANPKLTLKSTNTLPLKYTNNYSKDLVNLLKDLHQS